jgi:hypothetical protein
MLNGGHHRIITIVVAVDAHGVVEFAKFVEKDDVQLDGCEQSRRHVPRKHVPCPMRELKRPDLY